VAAFVLMLLTAREYICWDSNGFVWRTVTRSKAKLRVLAVALAMLLVAWEEWRYSINANTDEDAESLGIDCRARRHYFRSTSECSLGRGTDLSESRGLLPRGISGRDCVRTLSEKDRRNGTRLSLGHLG